MISAQIKKLRDKTELDDKLIHHTKRLGNGIKLATKTLTGEYKKHLTTAFSAALAFIIALYMRDTIQDWLKFVITYFNLSTGTGLLYKTLTTLFIIAICVVGIIIISKWGSKEEKK